MKQKQASKNFWNIILMLFFVFLPSSVSAGTIIHDSAEDWNSGARDNTVVSEITNNLELYFGSIFKESQSIVTDFFGANKKHLDVLSQPGSFQILPNYFTFDDEGLVIDDTDLDSYWEDLELGAVTDGENGAYLVQQKSTDTTRDLRIWRIGADGEEVWDFSGDTYKIVEDSNLDLSNESEMQLISDNNGGAIVFWNYDTRNGYHDIYAQKIKADGSFDDDWGDGKLVASVTDINDTLTNLSATLDDENNTVIMWQRNDYIDWSTTNHSIEAMRINSDTGNPMWGSILVLNTSPDTQGNVSSHTAIISDNHNGTLAFWTDIMGDGTTGGIMGQRIENDADILWDAGGEYIIEWTSPVTFYNRAPFKVVSLPEDEFVITTEEIFDSSPFSYYAQKIDLDNENHYWGDENTGLVIGSADYEGDSFDIISDEEGGIFFLSVGNPGVFKTGDVIVKKINSIGNQVWEKLISNEFRLSYFQNAMYLNGNSDLVIAWAGGILAERTYAVTLDNQTGEFKDLFGVSGPNKNLLSYLDTNLYYPIVVTTEDGALVFLLKVQFILLSQILLDCRKYPIRWGIIGQLN